MKRIVYIIVFCLFLISCSSDKTEELKVDALYNIIADDYDKDNPVLFSEIFNEVDIVPLETSDSFLISSISSLRYVDNKIFIWDNDQSTIFIFDRSGKAMCKINDRGDGPNQYLNIRGFDINEEEKRIYVYTYPFYVFKYTFEGKLDGKIKETIDCLNFATSGQYFLMNSANRTNYVDGESKNYQLWVKNLENKEIVGYDQFDPKKTGSMRRVHNQNRNFFHYKDEVLFFHLLSNNVLSFQNGKVITKYHLDFGKRNIPNDYFDKFSSSDKAYEELKNSEYACGFNECWENDKYFSINCSLSGKVCDVFYDKSKDELRLSYLKDDMTELRPLIGDATDDYLIAYSGIDRVFSLLDYVLQVEKVNLAESNKNLKFLLEQVNQDSNPVVFFYSFK